jgi:hypothetical protein
MYLTLSTPTASINVLAKQKIFFSQKHPKTPKPRTRQQQEALRHCWHTLLGQLEGLKSALWPQNMERQHQQSSANAYIIFVYTGRVCLFWMFQQVQMSLKKLLVHLPMLDSRGETC